MSWNPFGRNAQECFERLCMSIGALAGYFVPHEGYWIFGLILTVVVFFIVSCAMRIREDKEGDEP